jgi:membrane complex biogenesis BtpA family protein
MLASLFQTMDTNQVISSIFGVRRALIGMIHLPALPGTPQNELSVDAICEQALESARKLRDAGFHGLMIENMHDRPYLRRHVGPEIVAAMVAVGREVRRAAGLPLGVQVLGGANRAALATALGCDADFVRVEGFVFSHVADEGLMHSDAGELLRYRRAIGAAQIRVFADIKKKHAAHAITADIDLVGSAKAAEFFLADGIIVTGSVTGEAADPKEVGAVYQAVRIPTLVGSGVTPDNLSSFDQAEAFIVGSALKHGGRWSNPLNPRRLEAIIQAFDALPGSS